MFKKHVAASFKELHVEAIIVAHYGDGCFAMVMKYTDENGTKQACARILNMLSSMPWKIDNEECKLEVQIVSSMISRQEHRRAALSRA